MRLPERYKSQIRAILQKYSAVESAKLYGSRAKGSATERSDIDISLFGDNLDRFMLASIRGDFDESDIPVNVDVQIYSAVKSRDLKEHIDRVGIVIFEQKEKLQESLR